MSQDNREHGKFFEEAFFKQATSNGLFARKNMLSCKHTWGGRVQILKSQLDFTLVNTKGSVGFFDCKNFIENKFYFSEIDDDQLKLSVVWLSWKVPSGFVVWFRSLNKVSFFSGNDIKSKGPGNSFQPTDGVVLGKIEGFDLKKLL